MLETSVEPAIAALRDASYAVVSGRGLLLGTALETALKLEETCLRPVRGYSYADLRHGPISVVTSGMTAVLVAAQDGPMVDPLVELATDLTARGATVVGIGGEDRFAAACTVHVPAPTSRRRSLRSARSSPRSWSSKGSPERSGSTPTTRVAWPRSPPRIRSTDPALTPPLKENNPMSSKAEQILAGLGGADNIVEIEACITRLRTEVEDPAKVDEKALKAAGAHGVIASGKVVQVVVGPEADNIAEDIEDLM